MLTPKSKVESASLSRNTNQEFEILRIHFKSVNFFVLIILELKEVVLKTHLRSKFIVSKN